VPRTQSVPASMPSKVVSIPPSLTDKLRKIVSVQLPAASLQRRKSPGDVTGRPFQGNMTSLDLSKNVQQSEVMVLLVPDRLPEPPQSRRPLAELYYTTQTLPLSKLLPSAHKTLSTDSYQLGLLEGKLAVVHSRIEELKRSEKWSLRQMTKFRSPFRAKVHWDHLLEEMKWMQIDFKEERKLKIAICYELAKSVEDYWRLGKEQCCIKFKPIRHLSEEDVALRNADPGDVSMTEATKDEGSTPDAQINAGDDGDISMKDEEEITKVDKSMGDTGSCVEPERLVQPLGLDSAIGNSLIPVHQSHEMEDFDSKPSSSPLKIYMKFDNLNSASKEIFNIIPELPTFNSNVPYINEFDSLSLTSVTKFLAAPDLSRCWQRLVLENVDETIDIPQLAVNQPTSSEEARKKPLFFHDHKRVHTIRPPQPPNLKYLEYRTPTMWLPQDDQKLQKLVKDFQYNWNIVAMHMLPKSTYGYSSNIERRTSWQCFERWHQLNPNFPLSELKGPYAQASQAWLDASVKAQAVTKRRIAPLGVGPESIQRGHKRLRWASMFDGIRKSMRKRENVPKPNNTYQRKSQLPDRNGKVNIPTPMELSKMKHERDKSIAEAYAQQQRNTQLALSNNSQLRPGSGVANNSAAGGSAPGQQNSIPVSSNPQARVTASVQATNSTTGRGPSSVDTYQRQQVPPQRPPQGADASGNMPSSSPSAGNANSNARISTEQLQHMLQMDRHRQLLRQQAVANANTNPNTAVRNGSPSDGSASPIVGSPVPMGTMPAVPPQQGFSSPNQHLANLVNQISAQHPTLTSEQVTKLAYRQIQRYMVEIQRQQQQQLQQQHQQRMTNAPSQMSSGNQVPQRPPQQQPPPGQG
jgi:chromatin modification-related protein VID21